MENTSIGHAIRGNVPLSNDYLMRYAPSIFATAPWEGTSAKYNFIPTISVVEEMRKQGFLPVSAQQSRTRIAGKKEFTKHLLRFRNADLVRQVGDIFPELILLNSHDASSSYQIRLALTRLACLNGMVVCLGDIDTYRVRHSGNVVSDVIEASYRMVREFPQVSESIREMESIRLDPQEQIAFARAALMLRWDGETEHQPVTAEQIIAPRRSADVGPDLWKTLNVVQEHIVRGGDRGRNSVGGRRRTGEIRGIDENVKVNRALWFLAEQMKAMKAGKEIAMPEDAAIVQ